MPRSPATVLLVLVLCALAPVHGDRPDGAFAASRPASPAPAAPPAVDVRPLAGRVADEERFDATSPEGAFVAFARMVARGERGAWRARSIPALRPHLPAPEAPAVAPDEAIRRSWLDMALVELRRLGEDLALVCGSRRLPDGSVRIEARVLKRAGETWLNGGHASFESIEQARAAFAARQARTMGASLAPPAPDPETGARRQAAMLAFLEKEGLPPEELLRRAVAAHELVLLGECHHRPRYWQFLAECFRHAGTEGPRTLYLELPSHGQDLLDRFMHSSDGDPAPLVALLRDVLIFGWPDQALVDFLQALRLVNRRRRPEGRLRVICVDMPRPWARIRQVADWQAWDRDRHRSMARTLLADHRRQGEGHRGLAILGALHVLDGARYFEGSPMPTTTWWLRRELGAEKVFTLFSHMPVLPNMGAPRGRLRRGLFDETFLRAGDRPVAFALAPCPFADEPFDAFPEEPCRCRWGDAYDAFFTLGRLDDELHSPLVAGFYDEAFVREIERRHRLTYGRGWHETVGCRPGAESFRRWMALRWGRERFPADSLGSMAAWRRKR